MTKRKFFLQSVVCAGVLAGLWLAGLIGFVAQVAAHVEEPVAEAMNPTDAIVVLTGGSERIQAGLALLRAGKGQKLLISGVHPGVGLDRILAHAEVPESLRACCVLLGHTADNTLGNAAEARAFMAAEGFRSLRLVTANYHMPRSLVLFRAAMPEAEIVPYPVSPDIVSLSDWWGRPGTASLLIGEYDKYLYARVRAAVGSL